MRLSLALLPLLVARAATDCASRDCGRPGHGFVGYGIAMYIPVCAYSCQHSFESTPLVCTDTASFSGMGELSMPNGSVSKTPSDTCRAESKPFLTSVAWCIQNKCAGYTTWKLEKWWAFYAVGTLTSDPPPSLSYGQALAAVTSPPTITSSKKVLLNQTKLANESVYTALYIAIDVNQDVEIQHERFALVIFLSGVAIPIGFSFISRFLPFPRRLASALNGYFIYPLLLRPWRDSSVATVVGEPPTRGQALFVGYLILLNIFLSSFKYAVHPGGFNYWWDNGPDEIMGDLANRLGVLAFANFVLVVLYSSRNNVLLWLTDWRFSTFVLLHRWVGRIAILQTILHSVVFLRDWIVNNRLAADEVTPYWWWGCIGTIAASLLLPLSLPIIRQRFYEPFLLIHIIFSILVFVGSWYHIIFRYQHQWGYETWLYMVFAVWGFDRLIRLLRMLRNGVRTATITIIDENYIRIEVRGMVATGHVYLYFLQWRFWENHPFSVVCSVIQQHQSAHHFEESALSISDPEVNATKSKQEVVRGVDELIETGMVFYLRLLEGTTKTLRNKTQVKVLIEGSYDMQEDLSEYPTLVCISGGVGITACIPYMRAHPGNVHLYWGSRSQALIDSLKPLTHSFDVKTIVGQRLDLHAILESQHGSFAVVVSGPPSMIDETREIASRLSQTRCVKVVAESFTY